MEKKVGPDWEIDYRFDEDESVETMLVFGQIKVEDAIKEARYSLDGANGMNVGEYEILAVRRADAVD